MPLTGDGQVNKKAFRIAINSRQLARFHPLDREKTANKKHPSSSRQSSLISQLQPPPPAATTTSSIQQPVAHRNFPSATALSHGMSA